MNGTTERVALAIPEQRRELGLSLRQLARLTGVSRATIAKLEHGGHIDPVLLLRVATALLVLELHADSFPLLPIEVEGARRWAPLLPAELEALS
jgi:transcriptional regulator with XRE-family HTH domain